MQGEEFQDTFDGKDSCKRLATAFKSKTLYHPEHATKNMFEHEDVC